MQKSKSWYSNKWTYLAAVAIVVVALYFGLRGTVTYFNFNEYQKTKIDSLLVEMKSNDTMIRLQDRDIKELRLKLNKINTEYETARIKQLDAELKLHRSKPIKRDTIKVPQTPDALIKFFNNLIK